MVAEYNRMSIHIQAYLELSQMEIG